MWFDKLFIELEKHQDEEQGTKMSAYMRNLFPFLGIPKPKLKELEKVFLQELKKKLEIDWDFIDACWKKDYREAQYLALDYLRTISNQLTLESVPRLKKLAETKSWWDTIDCFDRLIGNIDDIDSIMLEWSKDDNFWIRRITIDHQLLKKQKTNTELLEKIIVNNLGQTEFFINKAIGWSLRDYSKVNPVWVKDFIKRYENKMDKLSIREASKYI